MDEETKQLLKDLKESLFCLIPGKIRVPCDCPPGEPIYGKRGELIDVIPAFSCCYCRLSRVVDDIYLEEIKAGEG